MNDACVLLVWDSFGQSDLAFYALPADVAAEHGELLDLVEDEFINATSEDVDTEAVDAALSDVSDRLCDEPEHAANKGIAGTWLPYRVDLTESKRLVVSRIVVTGWAP